MGELDTHYTFAFLYCTRHHWAALSHVIYRTFARKDRRRQKEDRKWRIHHCMQSLEQECRMISCHVYCSWSSVLFCMALFELFIDYCTKHHNNVLPLNGLFYLNIHVPHVLSCTIWCRHKNWAAHGCVRMSTGPL